MSHHTTQEQEQVAAQMLEDQVAGPTAGGETTTLRASEGPVLVAETGLGSLLEVADLAGPDVA